MIVAPAAASREHLAAHTTKDHEYGEFTKTSLDQCRVRLSLAYSPKPFAYLLFRSSIQTGSGRDWS